MWTGRGALSVGCIDWLDSGKQLTRTHRTGLLLHRIEILAEARPKRTIAGQLACVAMCLIGPYFQACDAAPLDRN